VPVATSKSTAIPCSNHKLASVALFLKLQKITGQVYFYHNGAFKLDKSHFPALECVGSVESITGTTGSALAAFLRTLPTC
jgi:hypothetical protein